MQNPYYTIKELAGHLQVKQNTIYTWINSKRIPALKIVGQWRFEKSAIEEWIKDNDKKHKQLIDDRKKEDSGRFCLLEEGSDSSSKTKEKRTSFRLTKDFPVQYKTESQPETFAATVKNISAGGIFLEMENKENRLSSLLKEKRLTLLLEQEKGILQEVPSEIAWYNSSPLLKNRIGLGLRWTGFTPETTELITSYILQQNESSGGLDNLPELSLPFNTTICVESSIIVKRPLKEVFALLTAIEKFPEFMENVKSVEVLEKSSARTVSRWEVDLEGLTLNWKQIDIASEATKRIRFRMVEGDFDRLEGEWRLFELLSGTEITLSVVVDWGVHSLHKYAKATLEKKTQDIFQQMLKGIKTRMWVEKVPKLVKFGFIIHPYDIEAMCIAVSDTKSRTKKQDYVEKVVEWCPSFVCSHVVGTQSVTGKQIGGDIVGCLLLPHQILNLNSDLVLKKVMQAAKLAEDKGAKILGLGAYAASVGKRGALIAKALNIPVTTGTSYTISTLIEAILKATEEIGLALSRSRVAVIGGTGTVGQIFSRMLADKAAQITLVARNEERLKSLGESMRYSSSATVDWTKDITSSIQDADIIIAVTNTPDTLIDIKRVRPGTIICDASIPKNVSLKDANLRRDVLVIDGGIIKPPGEVNFNFYFGLAPGLCYGCMAETMILALEERLESYSIGGNTSIEKCREIGELGKKHGFKLAELRSFGKKITEEQIEQLKKVR